MTIQEAIDRVDILKPNHFTFEDKVKWLSQLDGQIYSDIILAHEKAEGTPDSFAGYDNDTWPDVELLVPFPYSDDIYVYYLAAQIDLGNAEISKYNNDKTLYNTALQTYQNYYNRNHMPVQRVRDFRL